MEKRPWYKDPYLIIPAIAVLLAALIQIVFDDTPPIDTTPNPINVSPKINNSIQIFVDNNKSHPSTPNHPPSIDHLSPDIDSPQNDGIEINWTVKAYDPDGDQIFYQFFLNGKPRTTSTTNPTWIWATNSSDIGNNRIAVCVVDKYSVGTETPGSCKSSEFTISASTPNHPPSVNRLSPDINSPQNDGIEITWTANAYDPEGDQILYQFSLNGKPRTIWTTNPTWIWLTNSSDIGDSQITVCVVDKYSFGTETQSSCKSSEFVINERPQEEQEPIIPVEEAISLNERFIPSNLNGDIGDISFNSFSKITSQSGSECIEIKYSAAKSNDAGWANIYWVYPANNRGGEPGLQDVLTGANKLTFWARGLNGGEVAEFKMGGITGKYSDSVRPAISTGIIALPKDWTQYTIDLTGKNLSQVIGGFCCVTNTNSNPRGCTIYLDDIKYVWNQPD